jgi:hypothetical protein
MEQTALGNALFNNMRTSMTLPENMFNNLSNPIPAPTCMTVSPCANIDLWQSPKSRPQTFEDRGKKRGRGDAVKISVSWVGGRFHHVDILGHSS